MYKSWSKTCVIAAGLALMLTACGQPKPLNNGEQPPAAAPVKDNVPKTTTGSDTKPAPADKTAAPEAAKALTKQIKVYYSDPDLLKLVEKQAEIEYKTEADQYLAALNRLKQSPDAQSISLCKAIDFKSAVLKEGQLTVNLSLPNEARLGSGGEAMLLDALKKTVFQFNEVKSLEILVDGQAVESLMGHMDLPHPIKR